MRNFKELDIWINGMEIVKQVYKLADLLPGKEKFGLISQITRAAVSIPSNIAEGCAKSSEKEFKHFLEIAIGSAFELETQLLVIQELYLLGVDLNETIEKVQKEQRMLGAFISSVKKRISPNTKHPKPRP